MHSFTDSQGREWPFVINIGAARRLRDRGVIDIDRLSANSYEKLGELLDCPGKLAEVLAALCTLENRKAADLDGETGDVQEAMEKAFTDAYRDYLPPRKKKDLDALIKTGEVMQAEAHKLLAEASQPETAKELMEAMLKMARTSTPNGTSQKQRQSSDSPPTATP